MVVSRGFQGRRSDGPDERIPPGQYLSDDFPVLSAGPTPHTPLEEWTFAIRGGPEPTTWTWEEFRAAPARDRDQGHPLRHEVDEARHQLGGRLGRHAPRRRRARRHAVLAFSDGDYTTNLPLEDVSDGKAWVAFGYDGEPLDPEHGGPARLLVPHLYFWKSAKWVRGLAADGPRRGRLLGVVRLPHATETHGASSGTRATELDARRRRRDRIDETPRVRTIALDVPEWPGHRAGQHVDVRLTAEDGYQAQRSYSIASAPEDDRLAITVEALPDGEVSSYLVGELRVGDKLELRGPIGGYFVWEADRDRAAAPGRRRVGQWCR